MRKFFAIIFFFILDFSASSEIITFAARSMTGIAGSKTDTTILNGNAKVTTESMIISADSIEISGDDFRYIIAQGNVSGKNTESDLDFTCGRIKYDRKTKIALLEDKVLMKDNENAVTADAQIIEYNQNTEIATMQIEVTIKQKDNVCTSAYAVYRKKNQMLEMSGNPKIVQGQDSFRAQEITLNLDTQEIKLDGRVSGSVTDTSDDSKSNEQNTKNEQKNQSAPSETPETSNDETKSEPQIEETDADGDAQ